MHWLGVYCFVHHCEHRALDPTGIRRYEPSLTKVDLDGESKSAKEGG